ncbi:hypothetical protein [Amycolatopsis sp. NPDC004625]|uniref:hypothetical protein n=1 Tax=Amycolatopsis sp. NPDC004625 TaxID=3154670 RepID=UPI0033AF075C
MKLSAGHTGRTRKAPVPGGILLPWVALLATACAPASVAGSASPATTGPVTPAAPASPVRPASGAGTPGGAVERWVTQILQERYTEACLSSAPVLLPAGQDAETLCRKPEVLASAKSLHEAWAKPGVTLPPAGKVEVAPVKQAGDRITVPDTAIKLDGRTLRSIELVGATGDTGSFSLSLKVQRHAGSWYVTGFDLKA